MGDSDVGDKLGAVSQDGSGVCGLTHAEPAWLGAARGTEWWHCRSCGWVWHVGDLAEGSGRAPSVPEPGMEH